MPLVSLLCGIVVFKVMFNYFLMTANDVKSLATDDVMQDIFPS